MDPFTINRIAVIRHEEFIADAEQYARLHQDDEVRPGLFQRLLTAIGQQANRLNRAPAQSDCVDVRATSEQLMA